VSRLGSVSDDLTAHVRAAHADAWEVEGRLRKTVGGGAARVRGARLMASGIPTAQWNNADVTGADVDMGAMTAWYEARDVPWGVRVPLELELTMGMPLFVKRCAALLPGRSHTRRPRARVRAATEPEAFARLDSRMFGGELAVALRWVEPQFTSRRFGHWVAEVDGEAAAIGTTIRSDGDAGPAVYLTGLAGTLDAREAIAATATADAFAAGAAFVHTNPDDDTEAAMLAALGAVEVPGFVVRVVRAD
jgi:hypothetical protein